MIRTRAGKIPLAALFGTLLLCAAARGAIQPDVRLDGDWLLDTQASDSFDAKLTKLAEDARARHKQRRGARGMGQGEVPALMDELPPESHDELHERLAETFRPPLKLHIQTREDQVLMQGDAATARSFNLQEVVMRMDSSGTATIYSAWTASGLLVDSRYTNRSHAKQQFGVDHTGTVLTVTLDLTDSSVGRLQVQSIYHRASR